MTDPRTQTLVETIRARAGDAPVEMAMILGSGLGPLADEVEGVHIPYTELPGFPHSGVSGHSAELVIGTLHGMRVAVMSGREHYYENGRSDAMRLPLEVMAALGAKALLVTNACGSFRGDIPPGDLMIIADHINYSGLNPLIGEPTDARFVNMTDAYDPAIRAAIEKAAGAEGIAIKSGVYSWYSGPSFETPAEIRMLKLLGADTVGMSTVPEIILGRFLGLRCAAVSVITNMAAGLSDENISHEHTKNSAPIGAAKLKGIIARLLPALDGAL
ncbi:purine-nucleoside phosphorylase [Pseudooceanicola sp. 200-1SW]|uniref:purine-nucleoside phosphorylase n=1 Tax=Pseudooceanicola sp. 200-1SW TaxID=3425949 RepID=UPI003D7FA090